MYEVFLGIAVFAFLAMVVGLLKPGWVLFKSSNPTRGKVLAYAWGTMIVSAVLFNVTMPPEVTAEMEAKRKAEDAVQAAKDAAEAAEEKKRELAESAEKEKQRLAEEKAERRAKARAGAEKLFSFYQADPGNFTPGRNEQELVDGELLYECKVAGKYPLYFGRVVMKTTIFGGMVMPQGGNPEELYIFGVDFGDRLAMAFRGEEYVDALLNTISGQYGCAIPEKKVMLGKA